MDEKYLKSTKVENGIEVKIYQFKALHKKMDGVLNYCTHLLYKSKEQKNNAHTFILHRLETEV